MNEEEKRNVAAGIRMLASVLNESPTEDKLALLREVSKDDDRAAAFWANHADDDAQASLDLRVDWTKLFRGLSPDQGPRPPYELVYAPSGEEVAGLLDMKRLYGKAGLALADDARNRPDYLGFELDFAAHLLEREGEEGLSPSFGEFASGHLGWVPEFCAEAIPFAKTGFFAWYLEALSAFAEEAASAGADGDE